MRTILLCACFLALTIPASAQDQLYTATRQQLDVAKVVLAQQAAWNRGDMPAYLAFYLDAPDTVAMLAAPARGMANIRSTFLTNFPNSESMGQLDEQEVNARSLGDTYALVTGTYALSRPKKNGGRLQGTFSDVLQKTPAGWKIIFSETL